MDDGGNLVHLQVLGDEFAPVDHLVVGGKEVIKAVGVALTGAHDRSIRADDAIGGYAEHLLAEDAAQSPVGAADNVNGEVVGGEEVYQGLHGLVVGLAAGQIFKAVGLGLHILPGVLLKLVNGHALVGLGGELGVNGLYALGEGAVLKGLLQLEGEFLHILGSLIAVIVEGAVNEHTVIEVGRIELTYQGAVHIRDHDPVLNGDEPG